MKVAGSALLRDLLTRARYPLSVGEIRRRYARVLGEAIGYERLVAEEPMRTLWILAGLYGTASRMLEEAVAEGWVIEERERRRVRYRLTEK